MGYICVIRMSLFYILLWLCAPPCFSKYKCSGPSTSIPNSYQSSIGTNEYEYEERVRHYCVGVTELLWNYAPENPYVPPFSSQFKKAAFRQYRRVVTNDNNSSTGYCDWTVEEDPSPENGIFGPVLRAVLGDYIEIIFKNIALNGAYLLYAHGLTPLTVCQITIIIMFCEITPFNHLRFSHRIGSTMNFTKTNLFSFTLDKNSCIDTKLGTGQGQDQGHNRLKHGCIPRMTSTVMKCMIRAYLAQLS